MAATASLRDRILSAESEDSIKQLIKTGESKDFRFASSGTRSKWKTAASKRKGELHLKRGTETAEKKNPDKEKKKGKK